MLRVAWLSGLLLVAGCGLVLDFRPPPTPDDGGASDAATDAATVDGSRPDGSVDGGPDSGVDASVDSSVDACGGRCVSTACAISTCDADSGECVVEEPSVGVCPGTCPPVLVDCAAEDWACPDPVGTLDGVEVCNLVDDDCDGWVDEDLEPPSGFSCAATSWAYCGEDAEGNASWMCGSDPDPDDCNLVDDDGDGRIDEDCGNFVADCLWVSEEGHDENLGSSAWPLATIDRALDVCTASGASDCRVCLRAGADCSQATYDLPDEHTGMNAHIRGGFGPGGRTDCARAAIEVRLSDGTFGVKSLLVLEQVRIAPPSPLADSSYTAVSVESGGALYLHDVHFDGDAAGYNGDSFVGVRVQDGTRFSASAVRLEVPQWSSASTVVDVVSGVFELRASCADGSTDSSACTVAADLSTGSTSNGLAVIEAMSGSVNLSRETNAIRLASGASAEVSSSSLGANAPMGTVRLIDARGAYEMEEYLWIHGSHLSASAAARTAFVGVAVEDVDNFTLSASELAFDATGAAAAGQLLGISITGSAATSARLENLELAFRGPAAGSASLARVTGVHLDAPNTTLEVLGGRVMALGDSLNASKGYGFLVEQGLVVFTGTLAFGSSEQPHAATFESMGLSLASAGAARVLRSSFVGGCARNSYGFYTESVAVRSFASVYAGFDCASAPANIGDGVGLFTDRLGSAGARFIGDTFDGGAIGSAGVGGVECTGYGVRVDEGTPPLVFNAVVGQGDCSGGSALHLDDATLTDALRFAAVTFVRSLQPVNEGPLPELPLLELAHFPGDPFAVDRFAGYDVAFTPGPDFAAAEFGGSLLTYTRFDHVGTPRPGADGRVTRGAYEYEP